MFNRDAYIREVLDEDKRIYRQVFDREKEAVKVSTESVLPQKPSDVGIEIKVDSLINELKNFLENRIMNLEQLLTKKFDGGPSNIMNFLILDYTQTTGKYNQIVSRLYGKTAVDKRTQDSIKSKIMEIEPQVNSLFYSLREFMERIANDLEDFVNERLSDGENPDIIFSKLFGDPQNPDTRQRYKDAFPTMVAWTSIYYSIVSIIKRQIELQSYRPIDNASIRESMNGLVQSLPVADEANFVNQDPMGKYATVLDFYLNSRTGSRFGEVGEQQKIQRDIRALEAQQGRPATSREINAIRARYGGREERLFIDPRLPIDDENQPMPQETLSPEDVDRLIIDEDTRTPGRRQNESLSTDAIIDVDLEPEFGGTLDEIREQAEDNKKEVGDVLGASLQRFISPRGRAARGYRQPRVNTVQFRELMREITERISTDEGDERLRLFDDFISALDINERPNDNARRKYVRDLRSAISIFYQQYVDYIDNVVVPRYSTQSASAASAALPAVRRERLPMVPLGRPEEVVFSSSAEPGVGQVEPQDVGEVEEGRGRPRFSYKLGKVLKFDDRRNEMYS